MWGISKWSGTNRLIGACLCCAQARRRDCASGGILRARAFAGERRSDERWQKRRHALRYRPVPTRTRTAPERCSRLIFGDCWSRQRFAPARQRRRRGKAVTKFRAPCSGQWDSSIQRGSCRPGRCPQPSQRDSCRVLVGRRTTHRRRKSTYGGVATTTWRLVLHAPLSARRALHMVGGVRLRALCASFSCRTVTRVGFFRSRLLLRRVVRTYAFQLNDSRNPESHASDQSIVAKFKPRHHLPWLCRIGGRW